VQNAVLYFIGTQLKTKTMIIWIRNASAFSVRSAFLSVLLCMLMQSVFSSSALLAQSFPSYRAFRDSLSRIEMIADATERGTTLNAFFNVMQSAGKIPFALRDSAAFLYRGAASSVRWNGDMNGWSNTTAGWNGTRLGGLDYWILEKTFPSDARLDYKLVLNGNNWILDPANPFQQMSGFGPNSELRMPDFVFPPDVIRNPNAPQGTLSGNTIIQSTRLGYAVQYRVYTPAGYDTLPNLPVMYVTDGHEYANDAMGSLLIVLDNLIASRRIRPVLAVFIDPRNPFNLSQNRRQDELPINPNYLAFVREELVPQITTAYRTMNAPSSRAIVGTSLGGICATYFGIAAPETFGLIGIQSPAYWFRPQIQTMVSDSSARPLRIFMSTGVINDAQNEARQMRNTMLQKNYPLRYREVNQGHSWGNWRGLVSEMLIYFFPTTMSVAKPAAELPNVARLEQNYPNPFNPSTEIRYQVSGVSDVRLEVFDVLGRKVSTLVSERQAAGNYTVNFNASGLASGIYFYRLDARSSGISAGSYTETKSMRLIK
jgi:enterochelin esterase-like enzyme